MAVLKARISGQWVEVSAAPAELLVQEEGTTLNKRGKLNFIGNRITAADDAANDRINITVSDQLYTMRGTYSGVTVYLQRDIVVRFNAYWLLNVATATGVNPGESSSSWELIGGVPQMTTAQITAWTATRNGDQVWDTTLNQLYVRDVSWIAVGPAPAPITTARATLVRGPATDNVTYDIITAVPLVYGGVVQVNGRIEWQYNAETGTNSATYCQVHLYRSGVSLGMANGGWLRKYFTANALVQEFIISATFEDTAPGDEIRILMQNQNAANGRWQTLVNDNRLSGVVVTEYPP